MYSNIIIDPSIMRGKPTIKGTRITVEFIISQFADGKDISYILENYPHLQQESVYEALKYARHFLLNDQVEHAVA